MSRSPSTSLRAIAMMGLPDGEGPERVKRVEGLIGKMHTVYILRFSNNSLYIGQTNNLQQRLKDHTNKATRASKFSKENGEFKLVHKEEYPSQLQAMRREKQLKGWTRAKKEALIKGDLELLKKL